MGSESVVLSVFGLSLPKGPIIKYSDICDCGFERQIFGYKELE